MNSKLNRNSISKSVPILNLLKETSIQKERCNIQIIKAKNLQIMPQVQIMNKYTLIKEARPVLLKIYYKVNKMMNILNASTI